MTAWRRGGGGGGGSPLSQENGAAGPHFTGKMGTRSPHFRGSPFYLDTVNIRRGRTMPPSLLRLLAFQSELNRTENRFCSSSFCENPAVSQANSSLMRIPCGRVSCDFAFDCIPVKLHTKTVQLPSACW